MKDMILNEGVRWKGTFSDDTWIPVNDPQGLHLADVPDGRSLAIKVSFQTLHNPQWQEHIRETNSKRWFFRRSDADELCWLAG